MRFKNNYDYLNYSKVIFIYIFQFFFEKNFKILLKQKWKISINDFFFIKNIKKKNVKYTKIFILKK